jgi:GT2 family glycosyltransferase
MTTTNTDRTPATDPRSHAPPPGRPSVDVVVPFAGSTQALRALVDRLDGLRIAAGDSLVVVDNRPGAPDEVRHPRVDVVAARERQSSYHARNRGAARGRGDWLLFIDADVEPPADLVERYFARPAADRTAVLAGAVADEPPDDGEALPPAARWAYLQASLSQENTLLEGTPYAKTANCAVRREAFERVGGFRDDIRSGGDADLCFRLAAAGWELERRDDAAVMHRSRRRLRKLLRQQARHGSGSAWLDRAYPGFSPRKRWPGLAVWAVREWAAAARAAAARERDAALLHAVDPLVVWAFEVGRLAPNTVDRPATAPWRWARR